LTLPEADLMTATALPLTHFAQAPSTDVPRPAPSSSASTACTSYGEHEVLKGVSLQARKGDVISLIGSSGSGKSTFLRCINFLEQPNAGSITLDGETLDLSKGTPPRPSCRTCAHAWPWCSSTSTCGAT
jgi:histidine transport system ATP-binding protein